MGDIAQGRVERLILQKAKSDLDLTCSVLDYSSHADSVPVKCFVGLRLWGGLWGGL